MKKMLLYPLVIAILFSCSHKPSQDVDKLFYQIAVVDSMHNLVNKFLLSEVADSIEIIPLELNKSYPFSKKQNIVAGSDNVFICANGMVLHYGKDGKFIKMLGYKGQGPTDYLSASGIGIDQDAQVVYVLDMMSSRMLSYTYDGVFLKSVSIAEPPMAINGTDHVQAYANRSRTYDFVDGKHIFRRMLPLMVSSSDKWLIQVLDIRGNKLASFYDPVSMDDLDKFDKMDSTTYIPRALSESSPVLNLYQDHINFMYDSNDTIYQYNGVTHQLTPRYELLCGKRPKSLSLLRRIDKDPEYFRYIIVTDALETKDHLFITAEQYDMAYLLRVNKATGNIQSIRQKGKIVDGIMGRYRDVSPPRFTNDLCGDVPFYPDFQDTRHWITAVRADQLMEIVDVEALKQKSVLFPEKRDQLVRIIKNLKEDDADVLFIVTLK